MQDIPYEYNVDTRENKKIEIGQKVIGFSSLMGIDCGVKAVFQDYNDTFTHMLDRDNDVIPLHKIREKWCITSIFASSTCPRDLSKGVLRYYDYLIKGGNKVEPRKPMCFEDYQSMVRVYKDVFLLYDINTRKWVLSRIIIP